MKRRFETRFETPLANTLISSVYTDPNSLRPSEINQNLDWPEAIKNIAVGYDVDHCDPDNMEDCSLCTIVERDDIQLDPDDIDDYCIADCGRNRCHRKAKYGPFTVHGHAPKLCLQHYENFKSTSLEKYRNEKNLESFLYDIRWYEDRRRPFI